MGDVLRWSLAFENLDQEFGEFFLRLKIVLLFCEFDSYSCLVRFQQKCCVLRQKMAFFWTGGGYMKLPLQKSLVWYFSLYFVIFHHCFPK